MALLDVALAWAPMHQQHDLHSVDTPILDLLGVRYLLAPPDFPVDAAHFARVPGSDDAALPQPAASSHARSLADGYVVASGP